VHIAAVVHDSAPVLAATQQTSLVGSQLVVLHTISRALASVVRPASPATPPEEPLLPEDPPDVPLPLDDPLPDEAPLDEPPLDEPPLDEVPLPDDEPDEASAPEEPPDEPSSPPSGPAALEPTDPPHPAATAMAIPMDAVANFRQVRIGVPPSWSTPRAS
jgi:hypothetical protein